jgi:hypothetical protein
MVAAVQSMVEDDMEAEDIEKSVRGAAGSRALRPTWWTPIT